MINREQAKRCVGKGWHGLIDEFYDLFPYVKMIQVKEKYGTLCLYHDSESDASINAESEMVERSSRMCEVCGVPCRSREINNWIYTLCDLHALGIGRGRQLQ